MSPEMKEKIIQIIETKTYYSFKENLDAFDIEIYADYRDEIDKDTLKKICKSDNPDTTFYEWLYEAYDEAEYNHIHEMMDTLEANWDNWDDDHEFFDHEDEILEWLKENTTFTYPEDHYLGQDICVDIVVSVGDNNYEFTMNELFGCNYRSGGYEEPSGLIWLMKQQGYSEQEIRAFIESEHPDTHFSPFLTSVYEECVNTGSCMNALTFLVKMPLRKLIELKQLIADRTKDEPWQNQYHPDDRIYEDYLIIDKDVTCGLVNFWSGSGSLLEIKPEHSVKIPLKYVDYALPDSAFDYSIDQIYGLVSSAWTKNSCTLHVVEPVKEIDANDEL